jgi:hypothetical protein
MAYEEEERRLYQEVECAVASTAAILARHYWWLDKLPFRELERVLAEVCDRRGSNDDSDE